MDDKSRSKGRQGSSVSRHGPCQASFCWQVLTCTETVTRASACSTMSQCLSTLLGLTRET